MSVKKKKEEEELQDITKPPAIVISDHTLNKVKASMGVLEVENDIDQMSRNLENEMGKIGNDGLSDGPYLHQMDGGDSGANKIDDEGMLKTAKMLMKRWCKVITLLIIGSVVFFVLVNIIVTSVCGYFWLHIRLDHLAYMCVISGAIIFAMCPVGVSFMWLTLYCISKQIRMRGTLLGE